MSIKDEEAARKNGYTE
ncbi:hypothetical protein CGLO_18223 [Colletotrichum gloeosporioides Cg-14]|uniref:Uncharacterized protein n=1 Tax=Colletotrichum gloeosporioides (strain Cg-14) TaxID=1237896 RepID=T0KV37_COLGC|nr:hypothetical protein CGLO_18223 [Colletotrichum gloeosporioides Cg-14]